MFHTDLHGFLAVSPSGYTLTAASSVCGPRLWNALPVDLRMLVDVDVFKKKLKTFLFTNGDNFNKCVNPAIF